jgi:Flp pilus assembly protein TadG
MVAPFLAIVMIGMLELGRAMIVKMVLSDAARKGCRVGILAGGSSANITSNVNNILTDNSIDPTTATIAILVNGQAADPINAQPGDRISVQVIVPYAQVAWATTYFMPSPFMESEVMVMMRQG